ncbi:MAG: hypothetical protein DMG65_26730 [Candidatus Angelobacter sp. Gp1-AA117]|nr:MAG: hypothetical protein DMG65_26730 [Candidatus Angelobacter sp. Gp1-AA117]
MTYRILSLNGGGIRGIFQAFYLKELAKNLDGPISECFDLIAGTSTGSLIALGMALKIEPDKFVEMFKASGSQIFGNKRRLALLRKGTKYSVAPLQKVLLDIYGEKRLGDCEPTKVVVCSTVLNQYRHRIFTNIQRSGERIGGGDSELRIVDVALASSAAPTYFPSFQFEKGSDVRTYVDGGLWANNPVLVAVIYAHRHLGIPLKDMRLMSLGNGNFPAGIQAKKYDKARPIFMVQDILELMFSSQNTAADDLAGSLIGVENVLSLNGNLPEPVDLDDVDAAISILPPLAQTRALNELSQVFKFLVGQSGPLTSKNVRVGMHVRTPKVRQGAICRDEGTLEWSPTMDGLCDRRAVITAINGAGIFSAKLDIDEGKNDWAIEWLTADLGTRMDARSASSTGTD